MLRGLPPIPASIFIPIWLLLLAVMGALVFRAARIASDALEKGEVRAHSGLPDKMFGIPSNEIIWRAMRKRTAEGDREAVLVRRLQLITTAVMAALFFWPKST